MDKTLIRQVIELQNKSSAELRKLHEVLFGEPPRYNAGKVHLTPKIAYRLQELALGGLKTETQQKLESMAKGARPTPIRTHTNLLPGTKICKEWNGVLHEIEVKKSAFEYQGQPFKSLSAIARKITGTRWNGPKFFNLRGSL